MGERETNLDRGLILSGVKSKTMAPSKANGGKYTHGTANSATPRETKDLGKLDIDLAESFSCDGDPKHRRQAM